MAPQAATPADATSTSSGGGGGLSQTAVGGIIGGIVAFVVIFLAFWFCVTHSECCRYGAYRASWHDRKYPRRHSRLRHGNPRRYYENTTGSLGSGDESDTMSTVNTRGGMRSSYSQRHRDLYREQELAAQQARNAQIAAQIQQARLAAEDRERRRLEMLARVKTRQINPSDIKFADDYVVDVSTTR